jgi:hypothetical protein
MRPSAFSPAVAPLPTQFRVLPLFLPTSPAVAQCPPPFSPAVVPHRRPELPASGGSGPTSWPPEAPLPPLPNAGGDGPRSRPREVAARPPSRGGGGPSPPLRFLGGRRRWAPLPPLDPAAARPPFPSLTGGRRRRTSSLPLHHQWRSDATTTTEGAWEDGSGV